MFKPDTSLFLVVPGESAERLLQPATVVDVTDDLCTAELNGPELPFEEGMDIFLYREINRRFMQQPARVQSVDRGSERTRISFVTTGDPVSAESRGCYRASAIAVDINAKFGPEEDCRVLDVSTTGLSVYASNRYSVGSNVDVVVHFEGEDYSGSVVIRSAQEWGPKKVRYGVFCLDDRKQGASLKAALRGINLAIQRQQLQRLSGNR